MASCPYAVKHAAQTSSDLTSVTVPARPESLGHGCHTSPFFDHHPPWWLDPRTVCAGVPFSRPQPTFPVTDAPMNWGFRTQGLWSQVELLLHINVRELKAVHLACQMFQSHLEANGVSAYRQHSSDVLYKQTGCSMLLSPMPRSSLPVGVLHNPLNLP